MPAKGGIAAPLSSKLSYDASHLTSAQPGAPRLTQRWRDGKDAAVASITLGEVHKTGVRFIDDEHGELMALINKLHGELQAFAPENEIRKTFQQLLDVTATHFWHEEKNFAGYPRAAIHARKHQHLKTILSSFQRGLDRTGRQESFAAQLEFLRDWLMDHIVTEDKPFGDFLKAQEHSDVKHSDV